MDRRPALVPTLVAALCALACLAGCARMSVDEPFGDDLHADLPALDMLLRDVPDDQQPAADTPPADPGGQDPGHADPGHTDPGVAFDAPDLPGLPDLHDVPDVPDVPVDVPDVPTTPAWGWISAIEWNDTCDQWYLKTQWFGGVRAYFATAPNYNRALPHTLGFAKPVLTMGNCTLWDSGLMNDACLGMCMCLDKGVECYNDDETERWCGEDEFCIESPTDMHGQCAPLPAHFDVGTVTIEGLKTPVAMQPDDLDRYIRKDLPDPNDLFDAGDVITATTSGGGLPPLTFQARGVAPLEIADPIVQSLPGQAATLRWTPADPQSRIQVYLAAGSHDPNPLGGAILCDVPDGDGQVEIARELLDKLYYLSCNGGWLMKCSRITRYTRDAKKFGDQEVELFVGSARNLQWLY